jgi:hypothetical protein
MIAEQDTRQKFRLDGLEIEHHTTKTRRHVFCFLRIVETKIMTSKKKFSKFFWGANRFCFFLIALSDHDGSGRGSPAERS